MSGAAPDVGPKYAEIKVRCARKGYIRPCLNPVGQPGDMMYNHDDNVLQWCGGGLWHQAGPIGIHAPVSTTNIVGHWRLNSTSGTSAIDSSGNNHTGTLTNMDGNTDWVTGEVEGALDLDGSDDHVILGDLSINTNTLTITAWINLRSKDGYDGIVFSRPPATGMNIDSSGSRNLGYHWNDNSNTYSWDSGLTIPLNEWVMAAIVVEPTQATAYLYQNGTLSSAVNNVAHPTINPVNWLIGKDDIFTRWIDGMIDDVRIYTRALNATEIEALAQHCVDPAGKPGDIIYNSDYQVPQYCNGAEWVAVGKQATLATSCKAILDAGDSTGNGVYAIAPDGVTPISAYCDMTTDGGGWTMVAAQFENDPVPNWNEGIQGDYDPDLSTNKGFALNTAQLPAHTEIGFGKDLDPTFVDYVTGIYTTGNIATATVVGASGTYQIHRNASGHFGFHDPDTGAPGSDPQWDNTLTIDALGGGPNFNWAFSPQNGTNNNRGYAMASDLQTTGQSYAWSVWVR